MKRVEAALDNVTGKQLKELSDQARNLGPAVGKGATEAASGIEELGLAGLSTSEILGGGNTFHQSITVAGGVDLATRSEVYRLAGAVKQDTIQAIRDADRRRG